MNLLYKLQILVLDHEDPWKTQFDFFYSPSAPSIGGNVSYAVYHAAGPYLVDVLVTETFHTHVSRAVAFDVRALYANAGDHAMILGEYH